jgi:hypothetical protein
VAFAGSEELVVAAEKALGRRLPEPHRQRLIRENGGEVTADGDTYTLYPVWDPTDRRTIGRTANHIIRENESLRGGLPDALPAGCLAIASDVGGNLLVLRPASDDVFDWDFETGELTPVRVRWG